LFTCNNIIVRSQNEQTKKEKLQKYFNHNQLGNCWTLTRYEHAGFTVSKHKKITPLSRSKFEVMLRSGEATFSPPCPGKSPTVSSVFATGKYPFHSSKKFNLKPIKSIPTWACNTQHNNIASLFRSVA